MPIWQPCLLGLKGRGLRHAEGLRVSTETLPPPPGAEGTLPLTPGPPPPTPADPAPDPDPRLRAPGPAPRPRPRPAPSEPSNPRDPRRRLRPRAHSSEVGADPSGPRPHAGGWLGPARCGAASDLDRGLTSTRRSPRAPPPAPGPCRAAYQGGAALLSRPPCGSSPHQTGRTATAGRGGRTGRGRRAGRSAACREA